MAGTWVNAALYFPDELIASIRTKLTVAVSSKDKRTIWRAFESLMRSAISTDRRADTRLTLSSALASEYVTCDQSQTVDATDTITIGGTTLSVVTTPSTTAQFAKGASSAAMAANLATCINANPTLAKIVWAQVTTSASGIVTIYSRFPGPIGNLVTLAKVGNGMTLHSSALAGGTSDAAIDHQFGYSHSAHVAG